MIWKRKLFLLAMLLCFVSILIIAGGFYIKNRGVLKEFGAIDCTSQMVLKEHSIPTYQDEFRDSYCSYLFLKDKAPHGMVVVFGANKLKKVNVSDYAIIREFARLWTNHPQARQWPIATGGGSGVMGAATQGATEALHGLGAAISLDVAIEKSGKLEPPGQYNQKENTFYYRGISKREADLINHAQAAIFGLGGFGTEWEFFETIDKVHLQKIKTIPIIVLASQESIRELMKAYFTLSELQIVPREYCRFVNVTKSPQKAVELILMSPEQRALDLSSACKMSG